MVALYDRVDAYAADQLKFLRITQGVSQVTLGKSAGVSSSQIQKYENRIDRITAGRLYHFADLFGVKVAVFFPRTGQKHRRCCHAACLAALPALV